MADSVSLTMEPSLLKTYVFWGTVLIVKVLAMAFLTGRQRMKKKVSQLPLCVRWVRRSSVWFGGLYI